MSRGRTVGRRILFGALLIAVLAGLCWVDVSVLGRPLGSRIALWLVALGALHEALTLGARRVECNPGLFFFGAIVLVAVVTPSLLAGSPVNGSLFAAAVAVAACVRLMGMAPHRSAAGAFPEAVLLAAALLYTGGLLGFLDRILVSGPGGVATAFAVIAVSKSSDIAAYFVGTFVGRKRIAPALSPKKTWEGTIAGILASAGVAALLTQELLGGAPPALAAGIGAILGAASFLGDLVESGFKRWVDVKDSGALVPEFGGILDMLDGILVAAPVAVICLHGA